MNYLAIAWLMAGMFMGSGLVAILHRLGQFTKWTAGIWLFVTGLAIFVAGMAL